MQNNWEYTSFSITHSTHWQEQQNESLYRILTELYEIFTKTNICHFIILFYKYVRYSTTIHRPATHHNTYKIINDDHIHIA